MAASFHDPPRGSVISPNLSPICVSLAWLSLYWNYVCECVWGPVCACVTGSQWKPCDPKPLKKAECICGHAICKQRSVGTKEEDSNEAQIPIRTRRYNQYEAKVG